MEQKNNIVIKNILIGLFLCVFVVAFLVLPKLNTQHTIVPTNQASTQSQISPQPQNSSAFSNQPSDMQAISLAPNASLSDLADAYESAVATVSIMDQYGNERSRGSGIAVADGGYLVTNFHVVYTVINSPNAYYVELMQRVDGVITKGIRAEILWYNGNLDLAILRSQQNFDGYVPMCDRWVNPQSGQKLRKMEDVWTMSTPVNTTLYDTCTKGVIGSDENRVVAATIGNLTYTWGNLIQHSADISSGSSGSGLFDAKGQLIGINNSGLSSTANYETSGIFFAVPIYPVTIILPKILELNAGETLAMPILNLSLIDADNYGNVSAIKPYITGNGIYVYANQNPSCQDLTQGCIITGIADAGCTSTSHASYVQTNRLHEYIYKILTYSVGDTITIFYHASAEQTQTLTTQITLM